MSSAFQPDLDFEAADTAAEAGEALVVDLDGFEGPLHLLLALARKQKVDLTRISIATLADQYLAFVRQARRGRFALAADYLVMAAWLAYLKSRLLLPRPDKAAEEPPAEEMADALAFRLAKLDAMRRAADALMARPRTGWDVFPRGGCEASAVGAAVPAEGDLYELVRAYADQRRRQTGRRYRAAARVDAYPLEAARRRLRALLPGLKAWTPLSGLAPAAAAGEGPTRASYLASTLAAGLEMAREGELELSQIEAFAELYLKVRGVDARGARLSDRAA